MGGKIPTCKFRFLCLSSCVLPTHEMPCFVTFEDTCSAQSTLSQTSVSRHRNALLLGRRQGPGEKDPQGDRRAPGLHRRRRPLQACRAPRQRLRVPHLKRSLGCTPAQLGWEPRVRCTNQGLFADGGLSQLGVGPRGGALLADQGRARGLRRAARGAARARALRAAVPGAVPGVGRGAPSAPDRTQHGRADGADARADAAGQGAIRAARGRREGSARAARGRREGGARAARGVYAKDSCIHKAIRLPGEVMQGEVRRMPRVVVHPSIHPSSLPRVFFCLPACSLICPWILVKSKLRTRAGPAGRSRGCSTPPPPPRMAPRRMGTG